MGKKIILLCVFFVLFTGCGQRNLNLNVTGENAEEDQARVALLNFLNYLHMGKYKQAVPLYGGSYGTMIDHNPSIDPDDQVELLRAACTINGSQCLKVKEAQLDRQLSETTYLFKVQFENPGGSLFELGPCCGATETEQPSQSEFLFRVTRTASEQFLVEEMPPYFP